MKQFLLVGWVIFWGLSSLSNATSLNLAKKSPAQKKSSASATTPVARETQNTSSEPGLVSNLITSESFRNEVVLSNSAASMVGTSSSLLLNAGSSFWFSGNYSYCLPSFPALQVGGSAAIATGGVAGFGPTTFNLVLVPTINLPFEADIRNAFFADGRIGLQISGGTAAFLYGFDVGKRFKLLENLTYRPSAGIYGQGGTLIINLNFMSFSAVF